MNIVGIIPARYQSVRFPGKPLVDLAGKAMIVRTYEQVSKVKQLTDVVVATDDKRIYQTIQSAGGKVLMTSLTHSSGTDRCADALEQLKLDIKNTIVVNIQGDEPFIQPQQIEELISCFDNPHTQIATVVKELHTENSLHNPNVVKVVLSDRGEALYFSRSVIPFMRDVAFGDISFYKHIGIYAYRAETLNEIVKLPVSPLEKAESLEQLRWLQSGYKIQTYITQYEDTVGIDTIEDVEKALSYIRNHGVEFNLN
ncbi:MAG: 3-deoxy-manno-octulosonate cytidylyltransferase [Bacteroidales bacterium]|jgi:3-deoxy-manno-octulosonate cytidylyltransferase (CMP-KDO synthetase)|nr:3-deoxy-manno-octulosonate cytidylyltransferase [Bacteroidales bacterium]